MNNSSSAAKILGAIIIGSAIGGILGILFAPDKGTVTRKRICTRSGDFSDDVDDRFSDFLSEIKKEVGSVKDKATELIEMGKAKAKN